METEVSIRAKRTISDLLYSYGYMVKREQDEVLFVTLRDYETPLIIIEGEDELFFQLDIIGINQLVENSSLYKILLKMNMDLAPLSLAIDDSNEDSGEILVMAESLARENIDENELIAVVEAFEDSIIKVVYVLKEYLIDKSYITEGDYQ